MATSVAGNGCSDSVTHYRGGTEAWRKGDINMNTAALETISQMLHGGDAIPYLGPGVLSLGEASSQLPGSHHALVGHLTSKTSVPHKIRTNLTAAAQFIENFKHRKTVSNAMTEAFCAAAQPTALHTLLMNLPALPLIVHAWYDDLPQKALRTRSGWGMVQGVSQAEHFGNWVHYFDADGSHAGVGSSGKQNNWETLLYQPLGSVWPARNFLVSDSDFVEVLTEIDIQTPIPESVQQLRKGRSFLFLGCRFATQLERLFARQIMKRSSQKHWAILPEEPTRNEVRFLEQHNIERIAMPLSDFVAAFEKKHQMN
ncbi:MAG: SIR2 family NAD-dependent protein deacylase [Acidobacteriaceae bacterium]